MKCATCNDMCIFSFSSESRKTELFFALVVCSAQMLLCMYIFYKLVINLTVVLTISDKVSMLSYCLYFYVSEQVHQKRIRHFAVLLTHSANLIVAVMCSDMK